MRQISPGRLDELLDRYAKAGWQTWAPDRGAVIEHNGRRVRRVWLPRDRVGDHIASS